MGQALQIRVSAVTWNEDLVEKLWPQVADLAFSVPNQRGKRGVLEMVRALSDGLTFMDWSQARKTAMGPLIRKADSVRADLEEALAAWNPSEANRLSDELEAVLDQLEHAYVS